MRLLKAFGALVVLGAVLVLPPLLLVTQVGNPWPAEGVTLQGPLTDGAILGALACLVWLLWAQLVVCILAEATAAVSTARSSRHATAVPFTFGFQQMLARRLVGAVMVGLVATPIAAAGAASATTAVPESSPSVAEARKTAPEVSAAGHRTEVGDGRSTVVEPGPVRSVKVQRLDTLWGIAERELGDGARAAQIARLNAGRTMVDGMVFSESDNIRPGWELLIPAEHPTPAGQTPASQAPSDGAEIRRTHVVERGDSLSEIAGDAYGDQARWPQVYEANRTVIGADPDLIHPGQVLKLPATPAPGQPNQPEAEQPQAEQPQAEQPQAEQPPTEQPSSQQQPRTETDQEGARPTAGDPSDDGPAAENANQEGESEITVLGALLASAACLSVGVLGLVAVNRRRQFRSRRPGRTIASTPPELAEVEQVVVDQGTESQEDVEFLDRALRHLAACCQVAGAPLPHLGAAVLGAEDLTLLFAQPAVGQVPDGWTATDDARAWVLPRSTFMEEDLETQPAPYPALVSVGLDDGGRTWLLDLETLGVCGLGGESEQVADMARFIVAELAVNAWSEGSEVLLADQFGAETIGLNPARLRQVDRGDALARASVLADEMGEAEQNLDADLLVRRRDGLLLDTTNPVVVVMPSQARGEHADLTAEVGERERSRVVLVHGEQESPAVELVGDGMAFLPMWGVSVKAFTLPATEAESMAALLTSTRNVEDQPVPAPDSEEGPLGKYARADGSLREEYTEPRRSEGNDPSSLLPDADDVYLASAATTPDDMAMVAPSVPEEIRAEIEALDPTLDQDLADWFDESSPRPKVHLLGPVDVTALNGGDRDSISNLGATIEFIVYLACQERGVTGERAAEACGWKTQKTVQNRATNARFLLGARPDGSDWLPDASKSDSARRGDPTYELVKGTGGVLVDADLFVRLKFRAQKRGDNGCEDDLVSALSLVVAEPFDNLRRGGYGWLFQGQRHDHIMVTAIQDAAHVLATRAVADGRTDLVRVACDAARRANPHSDVAWLDLAAAEEADSGREAADKVVRDHVVDRLDEDLPARTEAVLDQRDQIRKLGSLWRTG